VEDFVKGAFQEIIYHDNVTSKDAKRLVICSGKVYYDLFDAQQKKKLKDVAIIRIEQLHPFPEKQIAAILKKYKGATVVFAQEEPSNMGPLSYIQRMMPDQKIEFVSRKASASPATGFKKVHDSEQQKIVGQALGI